MKLIDKEACMSEVFSFNKPLFTGENKAEMSLLKQIITDINNQPTVEAIPIQWLIDNKDWLNNLYLYDIYVYGKLYISDTGRNVLHYSVCCGLQPLFTYKSQGFYMA